MGKVKSILGKLKKKKVWIPLLVVVVVAVIWMLTSGGGGGSEIEIVKAHKQAVSRSISETGVVKPNENLVLGFSRGGRVDELPVRKGQTIKAGMMLASIDAAGERTSLQAAKAQFLDAKTRVSAADRRAAEASVETAEVALGNTREQQNLAVENAFEAFLNNDLQAYYLDGDDSGVDMPPVVTGTYTSEEQGRYLIDFYQSNSGSGYSFRYSGLEEGRSSATTNAPAPLGSRGLFLEFPENFSPNINTTLVVPIPNERSRTYVQAKNVYETAIDSREAQVEAAEARLASAKANAEQALQSASVYTLDALRAKVEAARAALANTTITAPISGTIAEISIDKGEIASPGVPVVTLLSANTFSVTVDIPEADIVGLDQGDTAEITFDAYDGLELPAVVTFVSPLAETKQGVTSVEVELGFGSADERLKSGITADVDIHTSEKKNVLAIPSRAVIEMNEKKFVRILPGDVKVKMLTVQNIAKKLERVRVTTGLRGTSGLVEITSGLSGGEQVVSFLPEALRKALEDAPENKEK